MASGVGIGLASHGIGTARAFRESEALNGMLTALLLPLVLLVLRQGTPR